jgi:hypothetical protein
MTWYRDGALGNNYLGAAFLIPVGRLGWTLSARYAGSAYIALFET